MKARVWNAEAQNAYITHVDVDFSLEVAAWMCVPGAGVNVALEYIVEMLGKNNNLTKISVLLWVKVVHLCGLSDML